MRRRDGFTLIELAVALTIIAIVSGVVIPRLPELGHARLESTARKLAATVSYLYQRSAATQVALRLTFDLDKNLFYVSQLNSDNQFEEINLTFARRSPLPDNLRVVDLRTSSKGKVSAGTVSIHFLPGGYAEQSVIHLENRRGDVMSLVVNPLTGKVKIHDGYRDLERAGT